jgi:hypothetical protein
MLKAILFVASITIPAMAYAYCTTQTIYYPDGRMVICTTCCNGGICNTTCL